MKQLSVTNTYSYRWWRGNGKPIKKAHIEALKESAEERIRDQIGKGFTSGELCDNIHMTARDPEDGVEYRGHWEFNESK